MQLYKELNATHIDVECGRNIKNPLNSVVGAKGGGAEEEKRVPPFFPSSLSPTAFDACYAWYLLEWWPYWFLLYRGVTQHFKKNLSKCFYFAAVVLFASCPLWATVGTRTLSTT